MKEPIDLQTTASFTFECTPADDTYKVGAFVITIPFEEIVRIEVFAFHPQEKPEEMAAVKGFASAQAPTIPAKRLEGPLRRDAVRKPLTPRKYSTVRTILRGGLQIGRETPSRLSFYWRD
jgi:hypothetical protein